MFRLFQRIFGFILLISFFTTNAQNVCFEYNFNDGSPNGWILSGGARVDDYRVPTNCLIDPGGIITPGVGGNLPTRIVSPTLVSNGNSDLGLNFDIYRLNSNLQCNSWSDYTCPTSIQLSVQKGDSTYTLFSNLVLPHNGPGFSPRVSVHFNVQSLLSAGDEFSLIVDFRKKQNANSCSQSNTKYIIDNISVCQQQVNVLVDAIDDNLCALASTTEEFSGNLSSNDIHPTGSSPVYMIVNGPYGNNNTEPGGAVINMNTDGSFSVTRTDPTLSIFDFTYRVTDIITGSSDMATCTVCFNEAGPLPLYLIAFNALRKNKIVTVFWKTSMENNLISFEIQRKINNRFVTIGSMVPKNNPDGYFYEFSEINEFNHVSEYRIKCNGMDNAVKYSFIKSVSGLNQQNEMTVYPNPSKGSATVFINQSFEKYTVELVDYSGKSIKKIENISNNTIQLYDLKNGIYFIKAIETGSGKMLIQQLVVSN